MPGRPSVRHRHTTEAYLYVVKGHGYSLVNYRRRADRGRRVVRGHAVRAAPVGLAPALQPGRGRHLALLAIQDTGLLRTMRLHNIERHSVS
jgi:hypothetical protein